MEYFDRRGELLNLSEVAFVDVDLHRGQIFFDSVTNFHFRHTGGYGHSQRGAE